MEVWNYMRFFLFVIHVMKRVQDETFKINIWNIIEGVETLYKMIVQYKWLSSFYRKYLAVLIEIKIY